MALGEAGDENQQKIQLQKRGVCRKEAETQIEKG